MELHGETVKVGDRLWDYMNQKWAVVTSIEEEDNGWVNFMNGASVGFAYLPLAFFWQEVPPITPPPKPKPEIDWSKVPEGTLVRVRDNEEQRWIVAEFSRCTDFPSHPEYKYEVVGFYDEDRYTQIKLHESVEPKGEWMK